MKLILLSVVAAVLSICAAAKIPVKTTATFCDATTAVPLLRANNPKIGDYIYTTDLEYTFEGTAGCIFPSQQDGTIPLFRLHSASATDHFYTTDTVPIIQFENGRSFLYYCGA
ncbi:hypothetical protein JB92DRAFT_3098071 [Gautieria morchelliformis]|nr:hypothetical protein JB92DRAFT_3098071 [Gautieria morchelliformis]